MALEMIDAATVSAWLNNDEALLIDVREPAEHAAQKIHGSVLLPLARVQTSALPLSVGKKIVIHCQKGGRSHSACEKLLREDPDLQLYNLTGGIEAWHAAGNATLTSGTLYLPLDRQVQLTIGMLLLFGCAMAAIFSPQWLYLSGIIGAGLMIAGLTGFCGLAILIAKMPWNQR